MHAEIKQHVNRDTVKLLHEMHLFAGLLEHDLLHKLVVALRTQFLPPGEVVCVEGEIGRHLFMVRKGTVEVRNSSAAPAGRVNLRQMHHLAAPLDIIASYPRATKTSVAKR